MTKGMPLVHIDTSSVWSVNTDDDIVRVTVTMTRRQLKALKQYSSFFGRTQSEVLSDTLSFYLQSYAKTCLLMQDVFSKLKIATDKRAHKDCFGYRCHQCTNNTACRTGLYDGVVRVSENCRELMTIEGKKKLQAFQLANGQTPQWMEDTQS